MSLPELVFLGIFKSTLEITGKPHRATAKQVSILEAKVEEWVRIGGQ